MSNPVINRLDEYQHLENDSHTVMTVSGTTTNFFVLSLLLLLPAAITWNWAALHYMDRVMAMMGIGFIVGFILALITTFNPKLSPYLAPLYAVTEGMAIGGLSAIFEIRFPGIVIQAVSATFAVIFVMFFLYKTGIIKVTEKFRSTVIILTLSLMCLYLINLVLSIFGFTALANFLWSSHPVSIGISVFACIIASLNLLNDFDLIERYSQMSAPKYMNWYCAFALMITVVWLYIEILELIAKLNRR